MEAPPPNLPSGRPGRTSPTARSPPISPPIVTALGRMAVTRENPEPSTTIDPSRATRSPHAEPFRGRVRRTGEARVRRPTAEMNSQCRFRRINGWDGRPQLFPWLSAKPMQAGCSRAGAEQLSSSTWIGRNHPEPGSTRRNHATPLGRRRTSRDTPRNLAARTTCREPPPTQPKRRGEPPAQIETAMFLLERPSTSITAPRKLTATANEPVMD